MEAMKDEDPRMMACEYEIPMLMLQSGLEPAAKSNRDSIQAAPLTLPMLQFENP